MLRALLAERFRLKVHRENREMRYLALVESRGGIKAPPIKPDDDRPFGVRNGALHVRDMAALATWMTNVSGGQLIIDQTGVTGVDVTIPIEEPSPSELTGDALAKATAIRDTFYNSLVRGAAELGVKVESRKGPLKVVVIDSADRPAEQ